MAATQAVLESAEMGQRWLDQLARDVSSADSADDVAGAIEEWAAGIDADDDFATRLYRTSFHTYLGGQLFVRSVELGEEADDGKPGTVTLASSSLHVGRRDFASSFFAMPFEEALAFFRDKQVLSEEEFDALDDKFKEGGFIARQLASQRLQEVARSSIERLLAQGLTIPECVQAIRAAEVAEVQALGIAPASNHYLDNVIRTNVATSYGAGRWAAMEDPAVKKLRPYRQYWTARDARVRTGHRALHGLVFSASGALASRYAPPLSFQCRCSMTTLSQRQFESRNLSETTERVPGIEAESFWSSAPAPLSDADL